MAEGSPPAEAAKKQLVRPRLVAVLLLVALPLIVILLLFGISTKHQAQLYCRWCGETRTRITDVWGHEENLDDNNSFARLRKKHLGVTCEHSWFKTSHTSWNLAGRETSGMDHWHDQLVDVLKNGRALPLLEKHGKTAEIALALRVLAALGRLPEDRRFGQQLSFVRDMEYELMHKPAKSEESEVLRMRKVLEEWADTVKLPKPEWK